MAAAKAFAELKEEGGSKFVFAFLSAAVVDQRPGKSWIYGGEIKGASFLLDV